MVCMCRHHGSRNRLKAVARNPLLALGAAAGRNGEGPRGKGLLCLSLAAGAAVDRPDRPGSYRKMCWKRKLLLPHLNAFAWAAFVQAAWLAEVVAIEAPLSILPIPARKLSNLSARSPRHPCPSSLASRAILGERSKKLCSTSPRCSTCQSSGPGSCSQCPSVPSGPSTPCLASRPWRLWCWWCLWGLSWVARPEGAAAAGRAGRLALSRTAASLEGALVALGTRAVVVSMAHAERSGPPQSCPWNLESPATPGTPETPGIPGTPVACTRAELGWRVGGSAAAVEPQRAPAGGCPQEMPPSQPKSRRRVLEPVALLA
mmetsp:Transcript_30941/g.71484  ORF Transcript_30941/g.71484 Transcript_30941/m.71484 type:complete len:317 (+) Transcript_30941:317-1267(+)